METTMLNAIGMVELVALRMTLIGTNIVMIVNVLVVNVDVV